MYSSNSGSSFFSLQVLLLDVAPFGVAVQVVPELAGVLPVFFNH